MLFVFKYWEQFCKELHIKNIKSIPAKDVSDEKKSFLVLKHDVEDKVVSAYRLAEIEHKYGHRGSYYVQAYLLEDFKNVKLLKKMQEMGHEISYHYDVMDSAHGNLDKAIIEFEENKKQFERFGFHISTVCQHGNPVIERVGYTSNRDFFRSEKVQGIYPELSDVMVDYKRKYNTEYTYYSDAGRKFKLIFDPINNDVINSDDKNVSYENLEELLSSLDSKSIISTHPHRWTESVVVYVVKDRIFKIIRVTAKMMMRVPIFKRIMSRYYYLAKKI